MERVPLTKPPFTIGDLKRVIPPHWFNRSMMKSFSYLAFDLVTSCFRLYLTNFFKMGVFLEWTMWLGYSMAQGCILTGVWVIAHECGHNAFSDYSWVDDIVGFALHSWLFMPYFSWKYNHRRHHSNSGSLEWVEIIVPFPTKKLNWTSILVNNPLGSIFTIALVLTLG
ncbi:hypothetical protein SUGI_0367140 [Cryptomeria japonica]|nr:hypothetical protein SUGI_0367140 [Cryptomeria japonica]